MPRCWTRRTRRAGLPGCCSARCCPSSCSVSGGTTTIPSRSCCFATVRCCSPTATGRPTSRAPTGGSGRSACVRRWGLPARGPMTWSPRCTRRWPGSRAARPRMTLRCWRSLLAAITAERRRVSPGSGVVDPDGRAGLAALMVDREGLHAEVVGAVGKRSGVEAAASTDVPDHVHAAYAGRIEVAAIPAPRPEREDVPDPRAGLEMPGAVEDLPHPVRVVVPSDRGDECAYGAWRLVECDEPWYLTDGTVDHSCPEVHDA